MNIAIAAQTHDECATPAGNRAPAGVTCLRLTGPLTSVTAPVFLDPEGTRLNG